METAIRNVGTIENLERSERYTTLGINVFAMSVEGEVQRMNALKRLVIIRFGMAALLIPIILYAISGTLHYWQGWLYSAILLLLMSTAVSYFLRTDPELLERRMKYKEKEPEQRTIVLLGSAVLIAGFLAIAIDLRLHGLNQVPASVVLASDAGIILGYSLVLRVFKENSYASRTIEVVAGQKVIMTGPYSIVRHPMYLGSIVIFILTPIALGSWRAVPVFLLYIPVMVLRILSEEKVLQKSLPGYSEYCKKKRYRLLPFIW